VIWSGGGDDIQWVKGTGTALTYSFDRHVIAIVRNFILGEVMGAILPALFLMGGSLLGPILREIFYGASQGDIFNSEVSIGQVLGSVGRLYFFIRIVPHAQQVVRYLVGRKSSESTSVINVRGDVSGGVVVAGSDARLNTEAAPGK
jgi:hypothetical protein